jgi:hypothetical protein
MAAPATLALEPDNWAVERATSLPEVWALIAEHRGVVGAWQLMRVCKASRAGAKGFLSTLPGLVVVGGRALSEYAIGGVWRLDLSTMRWVAMPALVTARSLHACCAVRGALVVLGGIPTGGGRTSSSVEMLTSSSGQGGEFVDLPPLSCGGISGAVAIAVDESDSAAGQVLLLGGSHGYGHAADSMVQLVDLATGACAQQPDFLHSRVYSTAGRLPDGRIVCTGGVVGDQSSAEVLGPPEQGGWMRRGAGESFPRCVLGVGAAAHAR